MQALCQEQFSITELTYPEITKIDTGFMPRTIFYYWALTKIDSHDVVMHCNTLCNPEWSELIDTLSWWTSGLVRFNWHQNILLEFC
jgi:hypothetical protein